MSVDILQEEIVSPSGVVLSGVEVGETQRDTKVISRNVIFKSRRAQDVDYCGNS